MKRFVKENLRISVISCLCLIELILYLLSIDIPEWFHNASDWFNILTQLSIGFLINFAFFITQVYIPRIEKEKACFKGILIGLNRIEDSMSNIFSSLAKKYLNIDNSENHLLNDSELQEIANNINFNDFTSVICVSKLKSPSPHFTVGEYLLVNLLSVEEEINKLLMRYPEYLTADTIILLESIPLSAMHHNLMKYIKCHIDISLPREKDQEIFLHPYYQLFQKISHIKDSYNI